MKKYILLAVFVCLFGWANAQVQPLWSRTINSLPDSARLLPVRVLNDAANNAIVLCTYSPLTGIGNKVVLNKYNTNGSLLWTYTYTNNGLGSPRGFDMALDSLGNCYVAGGFMASPNKPLLLKVTGSGQFAWMIDSTTAPINGTFNQLFIVNSRLYAAASSGIAVFNLNGVESWSANVWINRMAVDHYGQAIIAGGTGSDNLFRYDVNGNVNLSDSTIYAKRIGVDSHNNILVLSDNGSYLLVKYDSAGTFAWMKDSLPEPPPFGDIGFDVLTDSYDNVILVGLNDTMFKYSPSGNPEWKRSMNGLDTYVSTAKMFYDFILVSGAIDAGSQYDIGVGLFNSYGIQNWSGTYDSNSQQEFSVDVAMDNSGIFVLEDSMSNSSLIKFDTPFFGLVPVDYSLVCVDSVWYDTANAQLINVSIFNGDISNINYPSVMIISPSGDTISNRLNMVTFFAQLSNSMQTYTDSISVQGITDFSGYTFVISEGFADTSVVIQWCSTLSVDETISDNFEVFPNPFSNQLTINSKNLEPVLIQFFDMYGKMVLSKMLLPGERTIDVSELSTGAYLFKAGEDRGRLLLKVEY